MKSPEEIEIQKKKYFARVLFFALALVLAVFTRIQKRKYFAKKKHFATVLFFALLLVSPVFASLVVQPITVNAAATLTFGNTTVGTQSNPIAYHKDSSKFQLTSPGTIQSITVYFETSRFNVKTAIYSDSNGEPGVLISQSSSLYIRSAGWTTFDVPRKTLSAGNYWLAVVADSSRAQGRISYSGSEITHVEREEEARYSNEFTTTFGTISMADSGSAVIYATYVPSALPTPNIDPTLPPNPSPTATPTLTPKPTSIASSTSTPLPTASSTPRQRPWPFWIQMPTWTATPTVTTAPTPTATPTPISSPAPITTPTPTPIVVQTPDPTPTATPVPTLSSSPTPTQTQNQVPMPAPNTGFTPTQSSNPLAGPNVGVYSNSACTTDKTSITWGSITAGGTTSQTVYVKNTGTATMTLSLAVTNWTPTTAANYITITWNRQGTQLAAGQSISATLTITVSASITGITDYSNTITISGTG